jgi:hypothetical protein
MNDTEMEDSSPVDEILQLRGVDPEVLSRLVMLV